MERVSSFLSTAAGTVGQVGTSVAQATSSAASSSYQLVSGANRKTVEQYLNNFLNARWDEGDNPLEPASIHEEYRFKDDGRSEIGIDRILRRASEKNVTYKGQVVVLIQSDHLERFFFQSISVVAYGEGAKDETGKDVSFTSRESVAFGVVLLSKDDGKVILHEQRSASVQTE